LHIAPFSVKKLLNDMESTVRVLAETKGLRLTTQVEADVPDTLQGDAKRLHQILVNLINNSLKFTQKGGVDVRIYRPDADHWAFDVADTGSGISKDAQRYIFEPFRQADNSATRKHTGFGLGLAIVKQLVELMGGGVSVSSELGKGSTFSVVVPIDPPQVTKESA
jgi:signal transduction histidine kinase